jgi:hypothetical protein
MSSASSDLHLYLHVLLQEVVEKWQESILYMFYNYSSHHYR